MNSNFLHPSAFPSFRLRSGRREAFILCGNAGQDDRPVKGRDATWPHLRVAPRSHIPTLATSAFCRLNAAVCLRRLYVRPPRPARHLQQKIDVARAISARIVPTPHASNSTASWNRATRSTRQGSRHPPPAGQSLDASQRQQKISVPENYHRIVQQIELALRSAPKPTPKPTGCWPRATRPWASLPRPSTIIARPWPWIRRNRCPGGGN